MIATETWKKWEGWAVNQEFLLGQYLGGSADGAVFVTSLSDQGTQSVAIKLIPEPKTADAEGQLESWRLAATLSHPHLIRIFRSGRCVVGEEKLLYVVMEYAEEDLSHVVPFRPLSEAEVTDLLAPTLEALGYLHEKGLVHGHIKPANIMAIGDELKLSCDGVRRIGAPIGNAGKYDAPEKTASSATDSWGLGLTLVEILMQRSPIWDKNATEDPSVPVNLPTPLRQIAQNCLRRNPNQRCTIREISSHLDPASQPTPMPLRIDAVASRPRATSEVKQAARRQVSAVKNAQVSPSPSSPRRGWYVVPATLALLLFAAVVGVKLISRGPKAQPEITTRDAASTNQLPNETAPARSTLASAESVGSANKSDQVATIPAPPQPKALKREAASAPSADGVVHRYIPLVPQKSLDTIRGTVRVGVKVAVDSSGDVSAATVESPGPSSYFAKLAQQAAQQWRFASGAGPSSNWILQFEFSPTGVKVLPSRETPAE